MTQVLRSHSSSTLLVHSWYLHGCLNAIGWFMGHMDHTEGCYWLRSGVVWLGIDQQVLVCTKTEFTLATSFCLMNEYWGNKYFENRHKNVSFGLSDDTCMYVCISCVRYFCTHGYVGCIYFVKIGDAFRWVIVSKVGQAQDVLCTIAVRTDRSHKACSKISLKFWRWSQFGHDCLSSRVT